MEQKQAPINLVLHSARTDVLNSIETIRGTYRLPAMMMDGIVSDILADLRKFEIAELLEDMNKPPEAEEPTRE